ncbi:MAG: cell division protein FtsA, partial [Bacteroidales bacterium]
MNNYVVAIDLGTTKVVTLVGEKTELGYKVIAYREAPTKGVIRGEVVNIQSVLDSLSPLIKDIKQELEI